MKEIKKFFERKEVRLKMRELIGARDVQFVTSILHIVQKNNELQKADVNSIYNAALMAAIIDLPLNDNLGYAYIIPYDINVNGQRQVLAQFQIGYKGYIQLALRTNSYRTIGAAPVYEGQLLKYDPLRGHEFDFSKKSNGLPIGYASYFELLSGYGKTLYMTIDELRKHGKMYSKTFRSNRGIWVSNFDAAAIKTVIKLNLSKYAPMTIDLQRAIIADQAVINDAESLDVTYVDNCDEQQADVDKVKERIRLLIEDATTVEQLEQLRPQVGGDQIDLFNNKLNQLTKNQKQHGNQHGNQNPLPLQ